MDERLVNEFNIIFSDVAVDGGGGVFVTGRTEGNIEAGVMNPGFDAFAAKFDDSMGLDEGPLFLWAEQLEDGVSSAGFGIVLDKAANVFVTGTVEFESNFSRRDSSEVASSASAACVEDIGLAIPLIDDAFAVKLDPVEELCLKGDVNGDGVIDLIDVAPFVDKVVDGTYCVKADINCDGAVNLFDIGPFVRLISGG